MLPKKTRGNTVNLSLNLRFGDEESLQGKSTAIEMLGPMLSRGTAKLALQEFNDRLDELKANLSVQSARQVLNVNIETKRETLLEVLDLVREMLREPGFDSKEFELLRTQTIAELESQLQEPQLLAMRTVTRALNPYQRGDIRYDATVEEELQDVKALKLDDVKSLHEDFLSGSQGEVSVVGDFDPVEVEAKLSTILSNWKSNIPYQRASISPTVDLQLPMKSIETPDKANSVYFASQQYAMRDDDPNYAALLIGNFILGGGTLSSRLGDRVRQQEGLSYGVASMLRANPIDENASLSVVAIANPANRDKLVATIDQEIRKLVKEGVTAEELTSSIQGYLQSQQLNRSRDGALANLLAGNLFAGRDMTYYEKLEMKIAELDVETVNDAVSEYINPDNFIIATAGDFAKPTPVKPNPGNPDPGAKP
jgi:zinc protease